MQGSRVLIVEDSPLISDLLSALLDDLGCKVIGPSQNMAIALKLASEETIDIAIIDVFPAADLLAERGILFVFASGYAGWQVPGTHRDAPRLQKPFTQQEIENSLMRSLRTS